MIKISEINCTTKNLSVSNCIHLSLNNCLISLQTLPAGLDKSVLLKNGKLPLEESENYTNSVNQTKLEANQTITDNLTESDSLEQDGVLVVNVSIDNILNLDELFPHIRLSHINSKADEITNKIQSNSREITGDRNNNIKFKDLPDNITIGPAPTNGVLPSNEEDEKLNKTDEELERISLKNELRPTESLQNLVEEINGRKRRRRRHGNRRRYSIHMVYFIEVYSNCL